VQRSFIIDESLEEVAERVGGTTSIGRQFAPVNSN